jgi:hypothetical protein
VIGTVSQMENGTLELSEASGPDRRIPLSEIVRLEVAAGQRSQFKKGLLIGGAVGLAVAGAARDKQLLGCADAAPGSFSWAFRQRSEESQRYEPPQRWMEVPMAELRGRQPGSGRLTSQIAFQMRF